MIYKKLLFICLLLLAAPACFAQGGYEDGGYEDDAESPAPVRDSDDSDYTGRMPVVALYDFNTGEGFSWVDANEASSYLRNFLAESFQVKTLYFEDMKSILRENKIEVSHCRYLHEEAAIAAQILGADFFIMGQFDLDKEEVYYQGHGLRQFFW